MMRGTRERDITGQQTLSLLTYGGNAETISPMNTREEG